MEPRPELPTRAILRWLAIVADLGGTAWLGMSNAPLVLKLGVGGLELLGLYTIAIWYLARRHDWARRVRELDKREADPPSLPSA